MGLKENERVFCTHTHTNRVSNSFSSCNDLFLEVGLIPIFYSSSYLRRRHSNIFTFRRNIFAAYLPFRCFTFLSSLTTKQQQQQQQQHQQQRRRRKTPTKM